MEKIIATIDQTNYAKSILLKKEYSGSIKKYTQNRQAIFSYKLIHYPDNHNFMILSDEFDSEIVREMDAALVFISNHFNEKGISLKGIRVYIYDCITNDCYPSDFIFRSNLCVEIIKILNYKGVKVLDNFLEYPLLHKPNNVSIPDKEISEDFFLDKTKIHVGNFIPHIVGLPSKLRLNRLVESKVNKIDLGGDSFELSIKLFPSYTFFIHAEPTEFNQKILSCIMNGFKDFLDDFKDKDTDIGGFSIWFDVRLIEKQFETDSVEFSDILYSVSAFIHWRIKELFMEYGAIYENESLF
jgi:hypothetical protein